MLKVLICFYIAGNCYVWCSHVWHQYLLVGENPHAYQNPSLFLADLCMSYTLRIM
jgi:hypothetical protein